MAVYLTGDIHREIYPRFGNKNFPEQKELTKNDYVIVLGDFGTPWCNDGTDIFNLRELERRPFTTLFIDGNHENFDLLNNYPIITWHGGKVHKLNDSMIHLMRGQVFTIQNHTFFTFGGASSHDISDGILDHDDPQLREKIQQLRRQHKRFYRIRHISYWEEELPTQLEMNEGLENLAKHEFQVDYILTHCPPTSILGQMHCHDTDYLNDYLQEIKQKTEYNRWYFGHMHVDIPFYWEHCIAMYENITQIL